MDPRWDRIATIFHAVADLPPAEQRPALARACDGDDELERAVRRLLEADTAGDSVLEHDVAAVAAEVLDDGNALAAGQQVGPYRIVRLLAEGGMGVVYLALRPDLDQSVAIKVLPHAWVSPQARRRFAAEQRTLAQLTHRSIARLYDADTLADGTPWFAMEYVEGTTLTAYCREHQHDLASRLRLFREVCEAVRHAHAQLVIHRDLKPSNILVGNDGAVKLLDFGIAKQIERGDTPVDQTAALFRPLTPMYAAPEQIAGAPVGVQTDVYALGAILHELLTGQPPFSLGNLTPREAERVVIDQAPARPSLRAAGGGVTARRAAWADLDLICSTAMHKDPLRRYASVDALLRDVDHHLRGDPLEAHVDSTRYRTAKFMRRHARALAAASVALTLVVSVVAFYTIRLATARTAALNEASRAQWMQQFMLSLFDGGADDAAPPADLRVVALVDRGVQEARSFGGDAATRAALFHTLGSVYQRLGSYDKAEPMLRAALDQRRGLSGGTHADVIDSMVALGLLRLNQAKLDEAERLVRTGLAAGRRHLTERDPGLARATGALGKVLEERGDYPQAIPLLEESARLHAVSAPGSMELSAAISRLANAHFYAGHMDESETLNQRALAMDRRLRGDRHPSVAEDLLNLGAIASNRGQYEDAEHHTRDALAILTAWYGDDHPETASAQAILAQALVAQASRYPEASALLDRALATQERIHGRTHPRVAFVLNEVGALALRRQRFDDAARAFERTLDIYREVYPGDHFRMGVGLSNLASVHLAQQDYEGAEQLLRKGLEVYASVLADDHLNVGVTRIKLGRALVRRHRYDEAEPHLLAGHDIVTKRTSPTASWLRAAREDLVAIYEATGRPEQAARFRAELTGVATTGH